MFMSASSLHTVGGEKPHCRAKSHRSLVNICRFIQRPTTSASKDLKGNQDKKNAPSMIHPSDKLRGAATKREKWQYLVKRRLGCATATSDRSATNCTHARAHTHSDGSKRLHIRVAVVERVRLVLKLASEEPTVLERAKAKRRALRVSRMISLSPWTAHVKNTNTAAGFIRDTSVKITRPLTQATKARR